MPARPTVLDEGFLKAVQSEDALGAVVRSHLHIEAGLNAFIDAMVVDPKLLPDLRYAQKVDLACALGLADEHAPPLRALGKLRNNFAHELDSAFTREAISKLRTSLSKTDRAAVEAAYRVTHRSVLKKNAGPFEQLPLQMQFALITITLKSMLTAALSSAEKLRQSP